MPKPKFERKFAKFIDLKTIDDGPGGFEGHASISGNLDDGGDIILDGSFKDVLDTFLRSGFTAHSHEWDIKDGVIGYPMEAYEDENGLFVSMKFHSTDDAQKVRTKMRERIADNKEVGLSIGYRAGSPTFIYPKDFEQELPKYLKPEYLEDGLSKAKQFKYVRVLPTITELKEFSVVTSAMNQESQVTAVKGESIEEAEQLADDQQVEEKVGARNSSPDRNRIQQIHDLAASMEPASCPAQKSADAAIIPLRLGEVKGFFQEELTKLSELNLDNVQAAFDEAVKRVSAVSGEEVTEVKATEVEVETEKKVEDDLAEAKDSDEVLSNKAAYNLEKFRFQKLRTNALRQRAAQAG